ncbi:hypothetical protein [Aquimarina sp. I32.4]|uniref:hypothetical protein n=1 Tax=Aquimarina sp. I32.4 TaxID=2053903 RepID=UPI000CDEA3D6|nr:hypothetical protein [Aquimarina sp. I32.4]
MKIIKTIHLINKWSFILTLALYLTIYLGLIAQIFLGGIQIILASILLFYWKKLDKEQKKHLITYACLVVLYGLLSLTSISTSDLALLYLVIVPMSIAGYFVYVTYKIKNTTYEPKHNCI